MRSLLGWTGLGFLSSTCTVGTPYIGVSSSMVMGGGGWGGNNNKAMYSIFISSKDERGPYLGKRLNTATEQ